jgi:deoxyribonuclease-4
MSKSQKTTRRIGIHLSIAGGVTRAVESALELGINTLQVFLKSPSQWVGPRIAADEARRFRKLVRNAGILVFAHAGYLINLAATSDNYRQRAVTSMLDEMDRAALLGIDWLVVHPGSHGGAGVGEGIRRAADSLNCVLKKSGNRRTSILLETTAGQGHSLGARFEELFAMIDISRQPARLGVCIDTCHIFAAGYDFSQKKTCGSIIDEYHRIIGLERLRLIHLNDSKKDAGSRVDRHEHIGAGCIGKAGFRALLGDPRLEEIPTVLETPKVNGLEADRMNLSTIYSLIEKRCKSPRR